MNVQIRTAEDIENLKRRQLRLKAGVLVVAFFLSFIGGILIFRGILGAIFLPNSGNPGLNLNNNSTIPPFDITDLPTKDSPFGKNIKSSYTPNYFSDRPWILVNTVDKIRVGYLENNLFNEIYNIDPQSKLIHLYDDGSITYVINPTENKPAKLLANIGDNNPKELVVLDYGKFIVDSYYSPSEKGFYFSEIDKNSLFKLDFYNLDLKKTDEIYNSGFFNSQTKILNINSEKVSFKQGRICYDLPFKTKLLSEVDCLRVQRNYDSISYFSNYDPSQSLNSVIQGEIYQQKFTDEQKGVLYKSQVNEAYSRVNKYLNNLYFLTSSLTQVSPGVVSVQEKYISSFDLNSSTKTNVTANMPDCSIQKIMPLGDQIYVYCINSTGEKSIRYYNPNPSAFYQPVSYPLSSPISYLIQYNYWPKINNLVGVILDVQFLGEEFENQ